MAAVRSPLRRVRLGLFILVLVVVAGMVGYVLLGFHPLQALDQSVETVTTVGFQPEHPLSPAGQVFTLLLILFGVGTALYTFTVGLEVLIEGHLRDVMKRRRMERQISRMEGHVIICGWGRVGRQVARFLEQSDRDMVIVDRDAERIRHLDLPTVAGDVTEDETLLGAGIERAGTLIAALDTDADNLFVVVSGRALHPPLQIIARARSDSSVPKLLRAGADRVVNPQRLGGDRMGSFVVQPDVADFVDVVMHDGTYEFRLEDVPVEARSGLAGRTLAQARVHDETGALVLAIRRSDGSFTPNPAPSTVMEPGDVLIGVGTADQLTALARFAAPPPG
jgi:voltage-gated potassium channel